jgi:hypothetical protein
LGVLVADGDLHRNWIRAEAGGGMKRSLPVVAAR